MSFFFIFGVETESNKNDINNCTDLDFEMLNKCQVVGPPVTYDNPVQPYFLTASRKPVNK